MILYAFKLIYSLGFIVMAFMCVEIVYKSREKLYSNILTFLYGCLACLVLCLGSWFSLIFLFIWDHYFSNRVKIKKGE